MDFMLAFSSIYLRICRKWHFNSVHFVSNDYGTTMYVESNLSNKLRNVYFRVIQATLTVTCFDCTIVTGCDVSNQHFLKEREREKRIHRNE